MAQAQRMECEPSVNSNVDLEEAVTETFIRKISEQLAHWEGLASKLGLTNAKIHTIKADNIGNNDEIKFQMLLFWKQKNGRNATYAALIEGLRNADMGVLADEIQDGKYTEGLR